MNEVKFTLKSETLRHRITVEIPGIIGMPANLEFDTPVFTLNGHKFCLVVKPGDGSVGNGMSCRLKYEGRSIVKLSFEIGVLMNSDKKTQYLNGVFEEKKSWVLTEVNN